MQDACILVLGSRTSKKAASSSGGNPYDQPFEGEGTDRETLRLNPYQDRLWKVGGSRCILLQMGMQCRMSAWLAVSVAAQDVKSACLHICCRPFRASFLLLPAFLPPC